MSKLLPTLICSTALALSSSVQAQTQIPAFPGAEGFGAYSQGGRGGSVIYVTNLNDSGPGSFRDAAEQSGPRVVVFKVSGNIDVSSSIKIEDPYITIAGQTAPGDGITLRNNNNSSSTLKVMTHDVIIQHIRVRPGPGGEADGLEFKTPNAHDIIIDHSSFSWGIDENISFYTGDANNKIQNVTIQNSIIADALNCSTHSKGCHSKGLLAYYSDNVSILRNLFANNAARNPAIFSGNNEVSNNVIYNWGGSAVKLEGRHGNVQMNFEGNYLEPGADSDLSENGVQVKTSGVHMYLKNNYASHSRPDNSYAEDAIVNYRVPATVSPNRYPFPAVRITTPQEAYDEVLDNSGATLPKRDSIDTNIIAGVRNKTGTIIDSPADVGGYPNMSTYDVPLDSDNDGMPDDWEDANGLDKLNAADNSLDADGNGYTNIEEYLHSLSGVSGAAFFDSDDAMIVYDENGNGGESVTITANVPNNYVTYEWKKGSNVLSNSTTLNKWFAVGDHDLVFTATDTYGTQNSDDILLKIVPPNYVIVDAGDDLNVSDENGNGGESVTITATASNNAVSYEWKKGSQVIGSNLVLNKWFAVGTHQLTFSAQNADGDTYTDEMTLTIY